jgi:hypothetical protein
VLGGSIRGVESNSVFRGIDSRDLFGAIRTLRAKKGLTRGNMSRQT